jgi:hypothetical protein
MAERPRAGLMLITATGTEPDATAHGRTWTIPAADVDALAEELTGRFGKPIGEMVSTVADGIASGERSTGIIRLENRD